MKPFKIANVANRIAKQKTAIKSRSRKLIRNLYNNYDNDDCGKEFVKIWKGTCLHDKLFVSIVNVVYVFVELKNTSN